MCGKMVTRQSYRFMCISVALCVALLSSACWADEADDIFISISATAPPPKKQQEDAAAALEMLARYPQDPSQVGQSIGSLLSRGTGPKSRNGTGVQFDRHMLSHEDYIPSDGHHSYQVVKPKEYTFMDWLTSDGIYVGIIVFLFGIMPIVLGLIPFVAIASHFLFLTHKISAIHDTFWNSVHADHHQDDYLYTSGTQGWGWGW